MGEKKTKKRTPRHFVTTTGNAAGGPPFLFFIYLFIYLFLVIFYFYFCFPLFIVFVALFNVVEMFQWTPSSRGSISPAPPSLLQPCNGFLLGFTGFYWVLPSCTEFYLVLLGFVWFYWVLLGFTGFYLVVPSFT